MTGLRPIVDMSVASFMYVAMDQFISQAAKNRYMFGGQANIPVVFQPECSTGRPALRITPTGPIPCS